MKMIQKKGKKIVVGMSGGVDSSMALVLLKKQGWSPIGVSLRLPVWKDKRNLLRENICCSQESLDIAKGVCKKLRVPYHIFDVEVDFQKKVVGYFISEFKEGRTPNPCIICNRYFKFKKLLVFAQKRGVRYVATGHYTRVGRNPKTGKYELLRAADKAKDQTYNLCFLPQKWLKYLVFPLGDYTKKKVYQMAKKRGFDFFLKQKQSQDFCFVAGRSLSFFLKEKLGKKEGKILDTRGNVLGKHQGLYFYTIGQRRGLRLSGGPYYVKDFDVKKNTLIVTKDQKEVLGKEVVLSPFHFISDNPLEKAIKVMAKVRYRQPLSRAVLFPPLKGKLRLVFDRPQRAVTPGQFAVFYLPAESASWRSKAGQDVCLGGGRIL